MPSFCSYIAVDDTSAPRSLSKSLGISILGSPGGSCQANSKEGTDSWDYNISISTAFESHVLERRSHPVLCCVRIDSMISLMAGLHNCVTSNYFLFFPRWAAPFWSGSFLCTSTWLWWQLFKYWKRSLQVLSPWNVLKARRNFYSLMICIFPSQRIGIFRLR